MRNFFLFLFYLALITVSGSAPEFSLAAVGEIYSSPLLVILLVAASGFATYWSSKFFLEKMVDVEDK